MSATAHSQDLGRTLDIFRNIRLDWRQVTALLALTLVGAATEMGLPTLLALMIDDSVATGAREVIVGIAVTRKAEGPNSSI